MYFPPARKILTSRYGNLLFIGCGRSPLAVKEGEKESGFKGMRVLFFDRIERERNDMVSCDRRSRFDRRVSERGIH
jgi:hypothetical protein